MSVVLYSDLNNNGSYIEISQDTPILPPEWDAHSLSCQIDQYSIPCHFYSEPNFLGLHLILTGGGGCNDLDTLPGAWRNKIRSIAFGPRLDLDSNQELSAALE